MWIDEIKLIKPNTELNENGFINTTSEENKIVFGNRKSISRDEFYKSAQVGIKVKCIFELKLCDYNNEEFIEYENKRYRVLREYISRYDETIELTVTDISEEK